MVFSFTFEYFSISKHEKFSQKNFLLKIMKNLIMAASSSEEFNFRPASHFYSTKSQAMARAVRTREKHEKKNRNK